MRWICPPCRMRSSEREARSEAAALQVPATAETDLAYTADRVKDRALLKKPAPVTSLLWLRTKVPLHHPLQCFSIALVLLST
ncbi:hypothetical protein CgunFtcFv8_016189 [Champsocephalus gunnari]|uniref:Uncharacterized protein n=1 Tax=Champsocephalus gunnari TaxID=52237 RepID=A0AAN8CTA8_CHAGU|nr:hypothetical protein CgunFtcFv8_016189 [Champsocephalus gunnari]